MVNPQLIQIPKLVLIPQVCALPDFAFRHSLQTPSEAFHGHCLLPCPHPSRIHADHIQPNPLLLNREVILHKGGQMGQRKSKCLKRKKCKVIG